MTEDDHTKDLTEDLPKGMTDSAKLDWLMETLLRFMARDTNPLPPNYDARFAALENGLSALQTEVRELRADLRQHGHKLDELAVNALDVKAGQRELTARVVELEQRPN